MSIPGFATAEGTAALAEHFREIFPQNSYRRLGRRRPVAERGALGRDRHR